MDEITDKEADNAGEPAHADPSQVLLMMEAS
jgi:hypothetical protein